MNRFIKIIFCLPFITMMISCGDNPVDQKSHSIDPIAISLDETLFTEESKWIGSGRVLMEGGLRSVRDSFHIHLAGQFTKQDSNLVVHLFFDNFTYDTGLQIRLSLQTNLENSEKFLKIELAAPGYSFQELAQLEGVIADDDSFEIRIEAINKYNNGRRLLVWNEKIVINSQKSQKKDRILEGNADYDSLNQSLRLLTWGQGLSWGLTLQTMRMDRVTREVPFVDL